MEKSTKIILGIVGGLVLIGGGIGAYFLLRKDSPSDNDTGSKPSDITVPFSIQDRLNQINDAYKRLNSGQYTTSQKISIESAAKLALASLMLSAKNSGWSIVNENGIYIAKKI